jgi:polysaccharide biosynthesis protein PslE
MIDPLGGQHSVRPNAGTRAARQPSPVRRALQAAFRRKEAIAIAALVPLVLFGVLVLPKSSEYESAATLLVKVVDQDVATPDRLAEHEDRSAAFASNMAKQVINSELMIIGSEDVRRSALDAMGIDTVYPSLASQPSNKKMDLALEKLAKDFTASVANETSVIQLSVFNVSPDVARQTLQALLDAIVDKQASIMRDPRTQFLQEKLESLRGEVVAAQQALLKYKQDAQVTSLEQERGLLLKQRDEIESDLNAARAQLVGAAAREGALQKLLGSTPKLVAVSDESESMRKLLDDEQERAAAARAQVHGGSGRASEEQQRRLREAEARVQDLRRQSTDRARRETNPVAQRIQVDLSVARSEGSAARQTAQEREEQLLAINSRLARLDVTELKLKELERHETMLERDYKSYLERVQSANIMSAMNKAGITNLRVLQAPTLPHRPSRPRKLILFVLTLLACAVCGLAVCLVLEYTDDRFAEPDQVESVLGIPILSTITQKNRR